jgi:DNA-binding MarR family transcriptional regulator
MDTQDLRTLKILQEFNADDSPSQRYLSKKIDISLGLVNSFLKRLAKKGYFKITTIPRNRVKYILTPKGTLEKSRLTYEYIQHSFKYYRDARYKMKHQFKSLENEGNKKIVFYGVGDLAEIAYVSLLETSMNLMAVVDPQKAGNNFLGKKVRDVDSLGNLSFDKILITTINSLEDAEQLMSRQNIKRNKIITF